MHRVSKHAARPAVLVCAAAVALALGSEGAGVALPGKQADGGAIAEGRIAFARFPVAGNASIYTTRPSGERPSQLLERQGQSLTEPAWSPDGRHLAFAAITDEQVGGIFVASAAGKSVRRLTRVQSSTSDTVLDAHPRWSPDSRRIAFHRYRESGSTMHVVNPDGTALQSLGSGFEPSWSPDGKKIVFAAKPSGDTWDIYVMDIASRKRTPISTDPASDNNPRWSPDGRLIALQGTTGDNVDIYVMRADGGGRRRLTSEPGADVDPAWSPDGRRIVYASRRLGRFDLYVMNADGTRKRRLTRLLGDEAQPSWER